MSDNSKLRHYKNVLGNFLKFIPQERHIRISMQKNKFQLFVSNFIFLNEAWEILWVKAKLLIFNLRVCYTCKVVV